MSFIGDGYIICPMSYIDAKYLNLLSSQLGQFKRKDNAVWNFRCPYCGDSQTSKTKARGYVFQKEGKYIFKCHNCGHGASLNNLIKHVNPELHREYVGERFLDNGRKRETPKKTPIHKFQRKANYLKTPLGKLKKVSQLSPEHRARKYVVGRKIPTSVHYKLFYAPNFYEFVNECIPNKVNSNLRDEPRLVVPFLDSDMNLIGFQGRALGNSQPKYITIMLDENSPKIYGMDSVDWAKPVTVVEGPIDSMFLDNAIAMAGADLSRLDVQTDFVFCYDNEPRSQEIIKRMEKSIGAGYSVVVFPDSIEEKDINDMVLSGRTAVEIQDIITKHTYNGLMAMSKLSEWRKA